ncbi:MAG: nucleotide modification associated domain-containing protein [Romboutsia timonensis]
MKVDRMFFIVKCIDAAGADELYICDLYLVTKENWLSEKRVIPVYECGTLIWKGDFNRDRFVLVLDEEDAVLSEEMLPDNIIKHKELLDKMHKLYRAKNKDYGNSANSTYEMYGDLAYAVRINDKMNRINSLIKNGKAEVKDESLDDTILDLANYCVMWLIDRNDK